MRDTVGQRRTSLSVRVASAAAGLLAGAPLAVASDPGTRTPSIFEPVSTPAAEIHHLSLLVFGITAAIFAVVLGVLIHVVVRYRRRGDDPDREPPQVYGSGRVELAWTVVPILIVIVLFLATARTMGTIQKNRAPEGALRVTVVAHQWWWEFRYPDLGIVTANELHVPVGTKTNPRPVFLTLESADVIHSFWVPRLAGKTDVIPNHVNTTWIEPQKTGLYVGQCAEFCGTQHAGMLLNVVVEAPDVFARWVEAQLRPAVEDPAVEAGRALFRSTACVNCHEIRGAGASGDVGPDLTHLMSRATIGSGVAPNDREHLETWVRDPAKIKPGVRMPAMKLPNRDVDAIVDYLETLR